MSNKVLKIDDNWFIDCNDPNNCVLTFTEPREREKKTGEKETYNYENQFYFPNISSCLQRYLQESQKEATTVEDCIRLTNECMLKIQKLKF